MNLEFINNFNTLKKNLKKDFNGLKEIKVAVLGDSSTQFLVQALRGHGYDEGYNLNIFEADYNQIERQILDNRSELYEFQPEFVIIFQSTQKIQKTFIKYPVQERLNFAEKQIKDVEHYYSSITSNINAKIIYFNFIELNDNVFGNYSNKTEQSFLYQLRKINFQLMELSQKLKNLYICDYCLINAQFGKNQSFDSKMYYAADMVLSIDILPNVSKNIIDIISSIKGKIKKCLIIDLDNTMWGGIIGDDGLENIQIGDLGMGKVFIELQLWFKQLKERGIILAICSKNDETIAKEPFIKHPDMIIRLEDIAVFVANWNNKADNIKNIQSILNIGLDSMVFIDDNPFERSMVKTHLPDVCVPELPEDPAMYLEHLQQLNLFETSSFSEEDKNRTQLYKEEAQRNIAQKQFVNEDDFLASLQMVSEVRPFNKFNTPRVAQLSQRSNQFNLRTVRYTEEDISNLCDSADHITLSFNLKDKFGDHGLICVVILKKEYKTLFIDSWLMSCRVLKRDMENFTMNTIIELARKNGFTKIEGQYIPTLKNQMVKDHYQLLGFKKENDKWTLSVSDYEQKKSFIKSI